MTDPRRALGPSILGMPVPQQVLPVLSEMYALEGLDIADTAFSNTSAATVASFDLAPVLDRTKDAFILQLVGTITNAVGGSGIFRIGLGLGATTVNDPSSSSGSILSVDNLPNGSTEEFAITVMMQPSTAGSPGGITMAICESNVADQKLNTLGRSAAVPATFDEVLIRARAITSGMSMNLKGAYLTVMRRSRYN